jgi:hypothetical protein
MELHEGIEVGIETIFKESYMRGEWYELYSPLSQIRDPLEMGDNPF